MTTAAGPDPGAVFAGIDAPGAVWLDGGARSWSILAWEPTEILTYPQAWQALRRRPTATAPRQRAPFAGGWAGFIGYGVGHELEPKIPGEPSTPEGPLWLGRFDGGLCWHPEQGWIAEGTPRFQERAHHALDDARRRSRLGADAPPAPAAVRGPELFDRSAFEAGVRQIHQHIATGDCYQVNLTRAVHLAGVGPAFEAWMRLRRLADARYGAFLRLSPDVAILSSSPELLLDIDGSVVSSTPIKGTRPRSADPVVDRALALQLAESLKDRAELDMIVDLVRNDLGRVCATGTVRWSDRAVHAHPNVHHASRTITGVLRPERTAWDALAAVFPPGSVTGAPKIRACQRIRELEPAPRGVYCGAIGFVSDTGIARWNVAIRTAVWERDPGCGDRARYHVGGGITWDSDPADEWRETEDKGMILARAFGDHPGDAAPEFAAACVAIRDRSRATG